MKKSFVFKAVLSLFACLLTQGLSAQNNRKWENVDYAGDGIVGHRMDIHLPDNTASRHKVVVIVYGSAWFGNNAKRDAFRELGQPLLDAGFAVVCVNHRASTEAKFPAQGDISANIPLRLVYPYVACSPPSCRDEVSLRLNTERNVLC